MNFYISRLRTANGSSMISRGKHSQARQNRESIEKGPRSPKKIQNFPRYKEKTFGFIVCCH